MCRDPSFPTNFQPILSVYSRFHPRGGMSNTPRPTSGQNVYFTSPDAHHDWSRSFNDLRQSELSLKWQLGDLERPRQELIRNKEGLFEKRKGLDTRIGSLNTQIGTLNTEIGNLNTRISDLEKWRHDAKLSGATRQKAAWDRSTRELTAKREELAAKKRELSAAQAELDVKKEARRGTGGQIHETENRIATYDASITSITRSLKEVQAELEFRRNYRRHCDPRRSTHHGSEQPWSLGRSIFALIHPFIGRNSSRFG